MNNKTFRINFRWKENNNALMTRVQSDWRIMIDVKTPSQAAKLFHDEWTSENNGYEITSIYESPSCETPFYPVKFGKKNWK